MYMYACLFLLLLQIDVYQILADFTPPFCLKIKYSDIQECCPFKPLYATPAFLACGIEKYATSFASPQDCEYYACIFDQLGWMHLNGTVNYQTYKKDLDKWTEHQYNIKGSMQIAQNKCMKWPWKTIEYPREPFRQSENLTICQVKRLNACLRIYTQWYCRLKRSHYCEDFRWQFNLCRRYLFEP